MMWTYFLAYHAGTTVGNMVIRRASPIDSAQAVTHVQDFLRGHVGNDEAVLTNIVLLKRDDQGGGP